MLVVYREIPAREQSFMCRASWGCILPSCSIRWAQLAGWQSQPAHRSPVASACCARGGRALCVLSCTAHIELCSRAVHTARGSRALCVLNCTEVQQSCIEQSSMCAELYRSSELVKFTHFFSAHRALLPPAELYFCLERVCLLS